MFRITPAWFLVVRRASAGIAALIAIALRADSPPPLPIFDGRTLGSWEGNAQLWRVEDGAITGEIAAGGRLPKNEFIWWQGEVHDFDLTLEFRLTGNPRTNSGIQFRSQPRPDGEAVGLQADLDDGAQWLGALYEENGRTFLVPRGKRVAAAPDGRRWVDEFAPPAEFRALFRANEWNVYRVTATATHIEVRVNGTLTAVLDDRESSVAKYSGRLGLQLHMGPGPAKIQFRNIRLTDLGRTAPPTPAAAARFDPAVATTSIPPAGADGRPLNFSFETSTLADWTASGDAWRSQPTWFTEPATPRRKSDLPTDPVGRRWIGPVMQVGDSATGELTSAPFVVTHRWASYLVGGGKDVTRTRVEIVNTDTGAIIHQAAGVDSETLRRQVVDLEAVKGKRIFIRLVDKATEGPWGHLNFDDFVFHEREPDFTAAAAAALREHESPVLWHLEPNPTKPNAVANPDAQKLVAGMALTPGFQAELIAAEPDVRQPIAFAIDPRGRIWVAQAFSYPTRQPEGQGRDSIVILEDKDGDGVFETRKIFAEGLNLVSGLELGFGGVWVGAPPHLLFIPDRDHDDKPDGPPQVLLDGWGYQDTHETLNNFTWGPDGWLYGLQGIFTTSLVGKPGTPDAQRTRLRAGIWRYHPTRHEFEIFATGGSNQWGLDFNEVGHLFMTHCRSANGGGGTSYVIRNGHYWNQGNAGYGPYISNRAPEFAPELKNFLLASARYDSGEGGAGKPGTTAVYGGHAHVGTMIYLGDNWPDIYRDHLFTHNLHGHQINHQHNVRQGSGYETFHAGYDLLHVPDTSYLPVDLQYGPDGAVYVIDWSDRQHCHNPNGEAWDRSNGRVYRISWAQTYRPVTVDLAAKTDRELTALHTHKNEWFVRTARRLLQERAASRALEGAAITALRGQMTTARETSLALRAFWTLHVTGALGAGDYAAALRHPAEEMRAWAVQLATERPQAPAIDPDSLARVARDDRSPAVRLALAAALPALSNDARWTIATALATHAEDANDRYLPKMIWLGLAPLAAADLPRTLDLAEHAAVPALADMIVWFAGQTPAGRELLAARFARLPEAVALRGLRILGFRLEDEAALAMPSAWPSVRERFAHTGDAAARAVLNELSALFGDQGILAQTRTRLADASATVSDRQRALHLLKRVNDPAALPIYLRLLDEDAFRSDVIPLLAGGDDPAIAPGLMKYFPALKPADRAAALQTLTSRPALAFFLLTAVDEGRFEKKQLNSLHVRQLRSLRDARVNALLDRVWGRTTESSADVKATIARFRKSYGEAPQWAYNPLAGRDLFQRLCAACHTLDGIGGKLGPDLTGSYRNGLDYFLENIIDPNAVVGADFQLNVVTKRDGSVVSGMIERETDTVLAVRTTGEAVNIPKTEIKDRQVLPQSLMPPGLLESVTNREALELLRFLTARRG